MVKLLVEVKWYCLFKSIFLSLFKSPKLFLWENNKKWKKCCWMWILRITFLSFVIPHSWLFCIQTSWVASKFYVDKRGIKVKDKSFGCCKMIWFYPGRLKFVSWEGGLEGVYQNQRPTLSLKVYITSSQSCVPLLTALAG